MTRNFFYYCVVLVIIGVGIVGYQYYLESQEGVVVESSGAATGRQ